MKGSVAAFIAATQAFDARSLKHPVFITITADEEVGFLGAEQVQKRSRLFREMVSGQSKGIIGEPTELKVVYAHKEPTASERPLGDGPPTPAPTEGSTPIWR